MVAALPENVKRFYEFMREREAIRIKRERGDHGPWTKDEKMMRVRLTNVHRKNDRTTRKARAFLEKRKRVREWEEAVEAGPTEEGVRKRRRCAMGFVWNISIYGAYSATPDLLKR